MIIAADGGIGTRLIIAAENANVAASRNNGTAWSCAERNGIAWLRRVFKPTSTVKTIPPSGRVPYVETRAIEFALASCRRGTRLGSDASRAGPHTRERHSIVNDRA